MTRLQHVAISHWQFEISTRRAKKCSPPLPRYQVM